MINCLIIDDEKYARIRIRRLLEQFGETYHVFEAEHTALASELMLTNKIELIFLDIQMPKETGIEFLRKLENPPYIIFITASSDFALESYNLQAVDYLLKPYTRERFNQAMEKLSYFLKRVAPNMLLIRDGSTRYHIERDKIHYIKSTGNYVQLVSADNVILVRRSLTRIQEELKSDIFFKINRSCIVNTDFIKESKNLDHGDMALLLRSGETLKLSRKFKNEFLTR